MPMEAEKDKRGKKPAEPTLSDVVAILAKFDSKLVRIEAKIISLEGQICGVRDYLKNHIDAQVLMLLQRQDEQTEHIIRCLDDVYEKLLPLTGLRANNAG